MQSVSYLQCPNKRTSVKTGAPSSILEYRLCSLDVSVTVFILFCTKFIYRLYVFIVAKLSPIASDKLHSTQKLFPGISL
jgi:hypothetical protein